MGMTIEEIWKEHLPDLTQGILTIEHSNGCVRIKYSEGTNDYITFYMTPFPGCCAYIVSHNTSIYGKFRGLKLSYKLQEIKEHYARENEYTYMIATVLENNKIERKVLTKSGWELLGNTITNRRTGNRVVMYRKLIEY